MERRKAVEEAVASLPLMLEARVRYLVDLVTPAPGTICTADQAPFP